LAGRSKRDTALGQTQGYMDNVPRDGVKDPVYESNDSLQPKGGRQVYQSAESFGGKLKPSNKQFGQRQ